MQYVLSSEVARDSSHVALERNQPRARLNSSLGSAPSPGDLQRHRADFFADVRRFIVNSAAIY
jgi:hypothetical protein